MKKTIEQISQVFEKHECYTLYNLEEISESFGNGDGDRYYYDNLTFTKHSLEGNFVCFMSLHLKAVDLDKAIFKIEINTDRIHYTMNFRDESKLLLAVEEVKKCKSMINDLNKELSSIKIGWDE